MSALKFLLIPLLVLTGCNDPFSDSNDHHRYIETSKKTIDYTDQETLGINNPNGSVSISESDSAENIQCTIKKIVSSTVSDSDAESRLDDIEVTWIETDGTIDVNVSYPMDSDVDYSVNFDLTVPATLDYEINSGNGNITLTCSTKTVDIVLGNGNVMADLTIPDFPDVNIGIGNGNVDMRFPSDTNTTVNASVGNGSVNFSSLVFTELRLSDKQLQGTLGTGDGSIVIKAGNGNISLKGK